MIWGGAKDLYHGTASGTQAAANLLTDITSLAAAGAGDFMWLNQPQLGDTPQGSSNAAFLNQQSTAFDNACAADVALLNSESLNVIGADINTEFNNILATPRR